MALVERVRQDTDLQVRAAAIGAGIFLVAVIALLLTTVVGGEDERQVLDEVGAPIKIDRDGDGRPDDVITGDLPPGSTTAEVPATNTTNSNPGSSTSTNDDTSNVSSLPEGAAGPIVLPLDLTAVGFETGTVETTAADEGPDAPSYCNNRPLADGLVEWQGNRLTEDGGQKRVAQLVGRFETPLDASVFMTSVAEGVDCAEWTVGDGSTALTFHVTEQPPDSAFGDETKRFDLQVAAEGLDLFLRTVLIRSGHDVAQFTYVSVDEQDLALLDPLATSAVAVLGY